MRGEQAPVVERDHSAIGDEVARHPAFGVVSVTRWSSSGAVRLFGSDLGHRCGITLKFSKAEHRRGLSNDWHFASEQLLEVDLSESQWARMVASVGNGGGVPVTINAFRDGDMVMAPMIAKPEATKREVHGNEMAASLKKKLEAMSAVVAQFGAMIDEGKLGKKDLREMHATLSRNCSQIPGTVEFIYDQFSEATEKVAEDAKTEVEAHVTGLATRLGFEQLRNFAPMLTKEV